MSREAFEAWWKSSRNFVESPDHTFYFSLTAWQACEAQHEKELAVLQAVVEELIGVLRTINLDVEECEGDDGELVAWASNENC